MAGVVGVVGLATSFGMGAVALSRKSIVGQDCNTMTRMCTRQAGIDAASAGRTASAVSTAAFVIGALAVAGGVSLIAIGAPETPARSGALTLRGGALPGGGALSLRGTF